MSSCTIEDRFALFYLLTCPKSNITGSYSIIPRIAAAEIGWDTESQFLPVLRRLADSGFINMTPKRALYGFVSGGSTIIRR